MLTDDHLFVLFVKLCYECNKFCHPLFGLRANSWLNSPDIAQILLSFPPFPVDAKIGEGNGDGLRRVGRSSLTLGANESHFGVVMPCIVFIFHSLFIEVAIFTSFIEYQYANTYMIAIAILLFFFIGSMASFSTSHQPCACARTTLEARKGTGKVFIIASRSGAVKGFLLAENGPLVPYIARNIFKLYHGDEWGGLFESMPGYGLAGSSMALVGRVGGGIHLTAADVDATLIGRVKGNNPKDHPGNSDVIATIGGNVGDIVGTKSDLFGPTTALIVGAVSLKSPELDWDASFLDEPVLLIGFVFPGCSLEERARIKMLSDMHELSSLVATQPRLVITLFESVNPTNSVFYSDAICTEVPTNDLCVKDFLLVVPGETISADGNLLAGRSVVKESMLTGESLSVHKKKNSLRVSARLVNWGSLLGNETTTTGSNSTSGRCLQMIAAKIVQIVEDTQGQEALIQRLADAMAKPFVKCVVASSAATFVFWYLIGTQSYFKVLLHEIAGLDGNPLLPSLKLAVDVLEVSNPVNDVAGACRTGVTTNISILDLAKSYNIIVAALGMFSIIATALSMSHRICTRTDALNAAAMEIGIAIRSSVLVSCVS
ncbi:hypothetical protein Nepgr_002909 [Nepenthes gracilis]|uniref:H(+)-exporting diphosphatase n=1 Tax=Nepenthes gracilis TaxID=150966 RepID=A0AAD3RYL5_NEPGR|nr:hypothetical protein Nepgr_002909 [Nepenthes gracilis]